MVPDAKYDNVIDLIEAIENDEIDIDMIEAFDNKGELYIQTAETLLFQRYYCSHEACVDICALLGLNEPQSV